MFNRPGMVPLRPKLDTNLTNVTTYSNTDTEGLIGQSSLYIQPVKSMYRKRQFGLKILMGSIQLKRNINY